MAGVAVADAPKPREDDEEELLPKKRSRARTYSRSRGSSKDKKKRPKPKQLTFTKWLLQKPLSKLPFVYFAVGVVAAPALAIFHFMDSDTAYLICAAYIVLNVFGWRHFYTLIGLKKQVDDMGALNKKFFSEHGKLAAEVDKLSIANQSLRDSQNRIKAANAQNRENLKSL